MRRRLSFGHAVAAAVATAIVTFGITFAMWTMTFEDRPVVPFGVAIVVAAVAFWLNDRLGNRWTAPSRAYVLAAIAVGSASGVGAFYAMLRSVRFTF